jgi:hypothetical protein
VTGVDVIDGIVGAGQIERHDRELRARAALHEKHLVVAGDREQFTQIRFRLARDAHEGLAPVADLHDRHAAAPPIAEFTLGLPHDLGGQRRGSRREIENRHGANGRPALLDGRIVA